MALVERCSTEDLPDVPWETQGPHSRPLHVGITAFEVYIPASYVDQAELERHDGVSTDKYTQGLGQAAMSFVTDREDAVSMAMTVFLRLVEAEGVKLSHIGRLEVGTESSVDHCKSIKTQLMQLFEGSGNSDVLGVDCINACYGGTSAVMNAVAWVESSGWDGRHAIVICSDVAVYPEGPARPTGGAGAVAMLIGPVAALVPCLRTATSHMQHTYDFWKPSGLWPEVDGALSVRCYLQALVVCYEGLLRKQAAEASRAAVSGQAAGNSGVPLRLRDFAAVVMHTPFCKLVRKAHAWLSAADSVLAQGRTDVWQALSAQVGDKQQERAAIATAQDAFARQVEPHLRLVALCGNTYCASVWGGLASAFAAFGARPPPSPASILLFSYGSGSASTLLHIRAEPPSGPHDCCSNASLQDSIDQQLASRRKASPQEFAAALQQQEHHFMACSWQPQASLDDLRPGTVYLDAVDARGRRTYKRKGTRDPL